MADKDEDKAKQGGKLKMILLGVAGMALLALGAGGVYFFMDSRIGALQEQVDEAQNMLQQEMAPRRERRGEPIYMEFDPDFTLNISGQDDEHFLTVGISVLTYEQQTFDVLNNYRPMLRNSLVIMMGDAFYEDLLSPEGKQRLRDQVKQTIVEVMNDNDQLVDIDEVFFNKFLMQ